MILNSNYFKVLKLISLIINPSKNQDEIRQELSKNIIDWDSIVKIGSHHLILPSIYVGLSKKNILDIVPNELSKYLNEICKINENRNLKILKQVDSITAIFKDNEINYTFLKGVALLISEPFNSVEERMVGDIDILVEENHILRAKEVLVNNGYFEDDSDSLKLSKNFVMTRHLSRLKNKNYIASVELHRTIIEEKFKTYFSNAKVIESSIKFNDKYWIPKKEDLLKHTILNWYFNDNGRNSKYLTFRSVVDVINLEPLSLKKDKSNAVMLYFSLLSVFFHEFPVKNYFSRLLYKFQLNNKIFLSFYVLCIKIIRILNLLAGRFILFTKSKAYRKVVLDNHHLLYSKLIEIIKKSS